MARVIVVNEVETMVYAGEEMVAVDLNEVVERVIGYLEEAGSCFYTPGAKEYILNAVKALVEHAKEHAEERVDNE